MRSLEVIFRREELPAERVEGRVCAVIDVLRAGTTIARAFAEGAAQFRLFRGIDEADEAFEGYRGAKLIAGERAGIRVSGFDLGNSPGEFVRSKVNGRTVFFTTTNGTAALADCASAELVVMGALINATAISKALSRCEESITIVCSGTDGNYSAEDALCAGIIASRIMSDVGPGGLVLGDGARIALAYAADKTSRPKDVVAGSAHGKVLASLNLRKDLAACSVVDALDIVPVLKRDPLRLVLD